MHVQGDQVRDTQKIRDHQKIVIEDMPNST